MRYVADAVLVFRISTRLSELPFWRGPLQLFASTATRTACTSPWIASRDQYSPQTHEVKMSVLIPWRLGPLRDLQ